MLFKNYLETMFRDIRNGENIDLYFILLLVIVEWILRILQFYYPIVDKINEPLTATILFFISISLLKNRNSAEDLTETIKNNTCNFSDDFDLIDIRDDYQFTVKQFIKNTKSSLKLVLRTAKIIEDLDTDFEEILKQDCNIYIIMCNRNNEKLIEDIALYNDKTETQIKANFDSAEEEIKRLEQQYGNLIHRIIVDFHPPELLYISDNHDYSNGKTLVLPFSYKSSVRKAPSILFKNSDNPQLFEYYSELFDRMWEDNKND
ncbi:MAG: hypothetical protein QNJ64_09455 [Crocosphaera sp.]|nr:hypothetical protein [Crocosphaera sp.]